MTGHFADRLFRIAFTLAGFYNLAFGLWAALFPLAVFANFDLPPPRYPGIWACLGMVVGVYGFLYLHAAWKLETAWPIIAVGFLGKVLGPIGMLMSFSDDWPRRLGMICIYNDLIWWLPFGLFLIRGTKFGHWLTRTAPWICIGVHLLASLALVLLSQGTPVQPDETLRAAYIANHVTGWSLGWFLWMLSAMSFVGFCAWWGSHISVGQAFQPDDLHANARLSPANSARSQARKPDLHRTAATFAVLIAAVGTVFDFSGEGSLVLLLVERAALLNAAKFIAAERAFTLLSAGAANLLYTIAGIILTLATPMFKWVRILMWMSWLAGVGMTVAAIFDNVSGLVASSMLLFSSMLLWIAWMGARWRGP